MLLVAVLEAVHVIAFASIFEIVSAYDKLAWRLSSYTSTCDVFALPPRLWAKQNSDERHKCATLGASADWAERRLRPPQHGRACTPSLEQL